MEVSQWGLGNVGLCGGLWQSPHLLVEDLEGRLVTVGNVASRGDGDEGQKRKREANGHGSGDLVEAGSGR